MINSQFEIALHAPFDLRGVLQSHGWAQLLPNIYTQKDASLRRVEELTSGVIVTLRVCEKALPGGRKIMVDVTHASALSDAERADIQSRVRHMLRLDEDLNEFEQACARHGPPWSNLPRGAGRLLRSPTLFEDMLKVICTTNIQWSGTCRMQAELVAACGKSLPGDPSQKSFPRPEDISGMPLETFQESVRLGYRAAFIHALAQRAAADPDWLGSFWDTGRTSADIRKELLSIKGIGNYAAAAGMMLLGRYDDLPVDSVFLQFMRAKYFHMEEFDLQHAQEVYADWGRWKALAYWLEMTQHDSQAGG